MTKVVVITGATSGLGKLLAVYYANQNCQVFAGYRNVTLKKDLAAISENIIPFRIDMSKKWTVQEAIKFINTNTDHVDTLINAAGCVVAGPMECINVDKIREQFEVNTFSHVEFTQGLLDLLDGGKVINISSMASFGIFPFVAPYCASKRALDILFNSMLIECGLNIKFVSIKPGVIKTPLWEKSIENNKENLGKNEKYAEEQSFLIKNAQKNAEKGLDPVKVIAKILKVEQMENPKPTYVIGKDAKFAQMMSYLPLSWQNSLIKTALDVKMKLSK